MKTRQKVNRVTTADSFAKLLAGITQHVTAAIVLGGASITPQALMAIFQAALQAQNDLDAARRAVSSKVQAHKTALASARRTEKLLHRWAQGVFGPESPVLQDFGFEPAKPAEKSAAVKAGAAAKSTATRKAKKAAVKAATEPSAPPAPTAAAPIAPAKS